MRTGTTLLVIAKAPVPGRVKTRLCPPCTPEQAAALAEAALADTLAAVAATPAHRRVLVLDGTPGPWLHGGFDIVDQVPGGLDERLTAAFAAVDGPALLVGMDTPQISPVLLEDATRALLTDGPDASEAVLGLANDGGWWAIGLREPTPNAFLGLPMSTNQTGARQHDRLDVLGLRTRLIPRLRDVDSFPDARLVAAAAPDTRFARALGAVEARLATATTR